MRVAALYDIHGNLPALEAVLEDVRQAGVDQIVVGGDVVPGPLPRETLRYLLDLDLPVHFIHGNCELAVLALMAAPSPDAVTYWGTASGAPSSEPVREVMRWTAQQLQPDYEPVFASWPKTFRLKIEGLGEVLFCHSTPRSETEIFTRLTAEERLLPLFADLQASVVVCGHTHMQFDRMVGKTRVVNAGSVGMPLLREDPVRDVDRAKAERPRRLRRERGDHRVHERHRDQRAERAAQEGAPGQVLLRDDHRLAPIRLKPDSTSAGPPQGGHYIYRVP